MPAIVNAVEAKKTSAFPAGGAFSQIEKWTGKIHRGDAVAVMKKMPAESAGVILTSPPYNMRNTTGGGLLRGGGGFSKGRKIQNGYDGYEDNMPHSEYAEWQRQCLEEMMRLATPDGVIFYNHKWRIQNGLLNNRHDIVAGFPVRQVIIWHRNGGINFNRHYFLPTYEVIYMIAKKKFRLAAGANKYGDVWQIPQEKKVAEHMCAFPLELALRCIASTDAETVLDPFIGSGTTAIAAEQCGRRWIGIEKSPAYARAADKRIAQAKHEKII
ncbi:MAG: DNA-methyltransferase [Gammaproteobacteria bacterium]